MIAGPTSGELTFGRAVAFAYLTPLRRIKAVLTIFWPLLIVQPGILLLHQSVFKLGMPFPPDRITFRLFAGGFILAIAGMLFITLLFGSGIYRWHRHLVLDEPATMLPLFPEKRVRRFFWRWLGLGALFFLFAMIGQIIVASVVFPLWQPWKGARFSAPSTQFYVIGAVSGLATYGIATLLFALGGKRLAVLLPIAAAEPEETLNAARRSWDGPPDKWFATAIATTILPPIILPIAIFLAAQLAGIFPTPQLPNPTELNSGEFKFPSLPASMIALQAVYGLLGTYAVLVFASLLSAYYRWRVRDALLATPALPTAVP